MYIPTACTCFARLRERGCAGGGVGQFCDTNVCGLMWVHMLSFSGAMCLELIIYVTM